MNCILGNVFPLSFTFYATLGRVLQMQLLTDISPSTLPFGWPAWVNTPSYLSLHDKVLLCSHCTIFARGSPSSRIWQPLFETAFQIGEHNCRQCPPTQHRSLSSQERLLTASKPRTSSAGSCTCTGSAFSVLFFFFVLTACYYYAEFANILQIAYHSSGLRSQMVAMTLRATQAMHGIQNQNLVFPFVTLARGTH